MDLLCFKKDDSKKKKERKKEKNRNGESDIKLTVIDICIHCIYCCYS